MEYTLKNEQLEVTFTSLGASLHSIKDNDGLEYLWQGDKTYWSGQAPVLFPICGSIRGDEANIGKDKTTKMLRHGIVRKKEFVCEEVTKNSIHFSIESNEELLQQFPYPFKLKLTYTLEGNHITTTYRVTNTGKEEMPFFIGGHPGFNCPLNADEEYSDYYLEFNQNETCTVPTPIPETGLIDMEHRTTFLENTNTVRLSHDLFKVDAVILDELKSRSVKLCSDKHNKGIQLHFEQFPYLILWSSANDGPFVALEPWVGLSTCSDESDVFEEKRNVQKVDANKSKEYSFRITIL